MSEIDNVNTSPQAVVNTTQKLSEDDKRHRESDASQQVPTTASQADTVSLTSEATQLQAIQNTLEATPVVNSERVEALRAAIADGSYNVDATELAKNIIDFESQLF